MNSRRHFIKTDGGAGAALCLPGKGSVRQLMAQPAPSFLHPNGIHKFATPLLIPPVMPKAATIKQRGGKRVGIWLEAAQQTDIGGKVWNNHAPLASLRDRKATAQWMATAPGVPKVLDAIYGNQDDEYLDAMTLKRMLKEQ